MQPQHLLSAPQYHLYIKKVDETRLRLESRDSGLLMEISEHFTFYVDGYKFMPLFKSKMWDGKCRLYNSRDSTLPYGLLFDLLKFLNKRNYTCHLENEIVSRQIKVNRDALQEVAKARDIRFRGTKIIPHQYQLDAYTHACSEGRSLIISPTGSGKSLIIYLMSRWFLENGQGDILVIVPTTSLVEQLFKDFAEYSSHDNSFIADEQIHKIYSGKEKTGYSQPITVTTWQSAIKMPKLWFEKYGMVVGDEAHLFKAKSLNTIMSNCTNAAFRIGTTGTLDGSLCNERVLVGNFGPVHRVITTKELIQNNTLAQLKIKCIVLNHTDELKKVVSKFDYKDEINAIVGHAARNTFITKLACSQKGNTLVLFNLVAKHGKPLFEKIKAEATEGRCVFYVSGEVDAMSRENIREITDKHNNQTILRFGKKKIKVNNECKVNLSDGTTKCAKDITIDDDVCDKWISAWV